MDLLLRRGSQGLIAVTESYGKTTALKIEKKKGSNTLSFER